MWAVVVLALAALAVLIVHVAVDRATRQPPNYSRIEGGLWLGGYVAEPPPGTHAVLNLCEAEDPYQVESHRWAPIPDAAPARRRRRAWAGSESRWRSSRRSGPRVGWCSSTASTGSAAAGRCWRPT